MKKVTENYINNILEGLKNNDYESICKAGRLISDIIEGLKGIDVDAGMEKYFKVSLYRKFMRAYTRYILANPNCINYLAIDCSFTSMSNGEYTGIEE